MEVEEVNYDLHSLRKLYSLLQCSPENVHSITLDQQARSMLKDLLDHATKRLLETHLKIISTQTTPMSKSCANSPDKLEATTEMQDSPSPNLQNVFSALSKASLFQKLFLIVHLVLLFYMPILTLLRFLRKPFVISAKAEEQPLVKRAANTTGANRKLESRNKLCQTCGKRSMKRTNSIAERVISVEKIDNPVIDCDDQPSLVHFQGLMQPVKSFRRLASSSQTWTNQVEHYSHEDVDEISREASDKINQIDSCLFGPVTDKVSPLFHTINHRQSQADNLVPIRNPAPNQQLEYKLHGSEIASLVSSRSHVSQSDSMKSRELYHKGRKLLSRQSRQNRRETSKKADRILSRIPSQKLSQDPGKKLSAIVENTHVARHRKNYDPGGNSVKESRDQITRGWDERVSNGKAFKPSLPPRRLVDTKSKNVDTSYELELSSTGRYDNQEENPRLPMTIRPTLLGSSSRVKGFRKHEPLRSAKFRDFSEESVGSSTPSSSSSSWTTQQSNGSCTGSKGQSFPRMLMHKPHKNITAGSVQRSQDESSASVSTSYTSSYTSEQASASCTGDEGQSLLRSSTNESDSRSNSSFDTACSKDIKLQHRVGSKRHLVRRKSPINPIGRLRRIKNKLGLIFHHHHHHHHHHHNHDNKVHHRSSQKKDEGKKLHRSNNNHATKNKDGGSRGSIVPSKQKEGNFRALVEGLMRHIKQSRRPKKPENTIGQLGKNRHGHQKKAAKKLNYWQVMRQNKGVKLPQKNRVKLRYAGQNLNCDEYLKSQITKNQTGASPLRYTSEQLNIRCISENLLHPKIS